MVWSILTFAAWRTGNVGEKDSEQTAEHHIPQRRPAPEQAGDREEPGTDRAEPM
ncbi:hypothetical protein [Phytoactinopolyspora halophila]|uniref:hypothetical protein n=1 Tax=Phytoactinopolyspora halophila TaxID=1981511 RepID=UPI001314FD53|nr:hypothetical protein [Phytoactinopolyspora halophila]